MELKKNPNADVHKKKSTNLLIGLNTALVLILGMFFYSNAPDNVKKAKKSTGNEQVEIIPPTEQEVPKTPPPPPSPDIEEIDDDSDEEEDKVKDTDPKEDDVIKPKVIIPDGDGDGEDITEDLTIYTDVDEEGSFFGGEDKLMEFAAGKFNMPKMAKELEINGMIHIQFVVEKDGRITGITAIAPKARQLGYGLEQECKRVVALTSGKWKPAKRAGKPVRSYWRFPFEVDNSSM